MHLNALFKIIYLLINGIPQYIMLVPTIHPKCVFKWNPPEKALYGNMTNTVIKNSLKTPNNHAINIKAKVVIN